MDSSLLSDDQAYKIQAARELRELLLSDRYRPGYHFTVPEDIGIPGDPNGAFFANGRYHLMYLYNRRKIEGWDGTGYCWGHISSNDLVHWRHHPDALLPGEVDGGCFSGGGFLDDDGTAYISYWRLPLAKGDNKGTGIGIAKSCDRHYDQWEKLEIPSLDGTDWGFTETVDSDGEPLYLCNADPSNIWKKDGVYYMQAGNFRVLNTKGRKEDSALKYRGDWVDLFRSPDLINWEFMHRFYQRDTGNRWTQESEDDMCPSFLPLPHKDGRMSEKYLQLFISHNMGCQYYIGDYDKRKDLFIPETHGRMSWVDNTFFAPEALIDGKGRHIMWAWLHDDPHTDAKETISDGWAGVYGLPRVLWLGDENTLHIAPPEELTMLRYNARRFEKCALRPDDERILKGINGESCEIELVIEPQSARKAGLQVLTSPDGEETTLLYYDSEKKKLIFDATKSGLMGKRVVEEAPLELSAYESLRLRVYVDKSVVEIFANDRQAISRRVYPVGNDSDQIRLFCRGGEAVFTDIETWEMMPSNSW